MPAGPQLIDCVYRTLRTDIARTPKDIAELLKIKISTRAIRYAVKALVEAGKARRVQPNRGSNSVQIYAVDPSPQMTKLPLPEMQASA